MTEERFIDRDVEEVVAALRELPESIEPEHDLFPEIAARTIHRRRGAAWKGWAMAACLVAALGIGFAVGRQADSGPPQGAEVASSVSPASSPEPAIVRAVDGVAAGGTSIHRAEMELLRAKEQLHFVLGQRQDSLSPETRRLLDENLATVERAIEELRSAIVADPGNRDLQRRLVTYHEQEIQLLQRVTRAASRL